MANDLKWLIGSDFHIPFNSKRGTDLFFAIRDWFEPDVIDIAGDLDDACPVSRFSDGTPDEVIDNVATYAPLVQDFFKDLRDGSPEAEIWYHTGNHENRYDDYTAKKAPAYAGLITPEVLWKTDTYGIQLSYYNNPPIHRFGDVYIHHGPYALKNSGESVRKVLDDYQVSCIVGHSHRQSYVAKSYSLPGVELRGWELGHFTDINSSGMAYDRKHDWQMGGAIAHIVNDYPHVSLFHINKDFECVVDGKLFKA